MKRAQLPALLSPQPVFRGFPPIVKAMLGGAPYAVNRHEISFPVGKMAAKLARRAALAPVSGLHETPCRGRIRLILPRMEKETP
jgi:hypothetical protein